MKKSTTVEKKHKKMCRAPPREDVADNTKQGKITIIRTTTYYTFLKGSKEVLFLPKTRDLLGEMVKNTGRPKDNKSTLQAQPQQFVVRVM